MTKSRTPIILMVVFSVLVALSPLRTILLGLAQSFPEMLDHISQRKIAFLLHITLSPVALTIGAVQMLPRFRARHLTVHRWLGRLYAGAVLVSGLAALPVAFTAQGGTPVALGFGILSVIWIYTTGSAVYCAITGDIAQHRRWMIRSFALTFAAVNLRLYLVGFIAFGFSYTEASPYLAWMCWVPNLMFAQWWLGRTDLKQRMTNVGHSA